MKIVVCIKQVPDTTEIKLDRYGDDDPGWGAQHYESRR